MNVHSAENLISCHRPGVTASSSVQKALKMAESDEILRGMLEANGKFDAQMVEVIHVVKPPDSLKKKIADCAAPQEIRNHANHPAILCAIAGALLAIGFVVYLEMEQRAGFPGKENAAKMVGQLSQMSGVELEVKSGTVGGLADWFLLRGFDGMQLPPDVSKLTAAGARTYRVSGNEVAQIAIGDDEHAPILNVFRAADFGIELEEGADWKSFAEGEWAAAIRQRGGVCTMFAFRGSVEEMQKFVVSLEP